MESAMTATKSAGGAPSDEFVQRCGALLGLWLGSKRRANTQRSYSDGLAAFQGWLKARTAADSAVRLLSLGPAGARDLVVDYRNAERERGLSVASANHRVATLRSLVRYAADSGVIHWTLSVRDLPREHARDLAGPTSHEINAMLGEIDTYEDPAGRWVGKSARDRAVLLLMYPLGLKNSEIVDLDLIDVSLSESCVFVSRRGRVKEKVALPASVRRALEEWIAVRGTHNGPLLPGDTEDGRIALRSLTRIVALLADAAGLKGVTPRRLRNSTANEALQESGNDIAAVAQILGHGTRYTAAYVKGNAPASHITERLSRRLMFPSESENPSAASSSARPSPRSSPTATSPARQQSPVPITAMPIALTTEYLVSWLVENARPELDERVWVQLERGWPCDVALGVGWSPRDPWRCLGETKRLLADPRSHVVRAHLEVAIEDLD